MAWPTPQDYNEAVQNPRMAFSDSELRTGEPELTPLGLPRPISGNFACVYKIQTGGLRWAARCFISEVSDQQRRYEVISGYLARAAIPYTVQFTYLPAGIKVQGHQYPLLKMQWVQGESLNAFVGKYLGYPETLLSLAGVWAKMMGDLQQAGIAHGDLQHGNVLVVEKKLRLIDYDGMYVPGLEGNQSNELGHRNYQLPTRTGWDYGPHLDNFSAWVIYVSLVALAVHPELWHKYQGGDECLIFRKEDFLEPENSNLLLDLKASPNDQLRFLVELFTSLFHLSPQDIPSLDGNLTEIKVEPPRPWWLDHAESAPTRDEPAPKTKTVEKKQEPVPDPSWIVDSLLEDKPVDPVTFQTSGKVIRLTAVGSAVLVILAGLLAQMPVSELVIVVSCALGLNLLVCFVRFKCDPGTKHFASFQKETKVFANQVREHQRLIDKVSSERALIQEKISKSDTVFAEQKGAWDASLQGQLSNSQAELNAQLQLINQRRADLAAFEKNKLDSLQETLGNDMAATNRALAGLAFREADEKSRATSIIQEQHIQDYLRGFTIKDTWIPGISDAFKSRLIFGGFSTAADIDVNVGDVLGIGPARQSALMQWRRGLESEAIRGAPKLPPQETLAIETKYHLERQTLNDAKQRLQSHFNEQIISVRQYFADARQSLQQEEQQVRSANAQKRVYTQQEYDAAIASLDKQTIEARNLLAPKMNELSEKLRSAQKQVFALRWQSAKREKEGRRYESIRFKKYLHKVATSA